MIFLTITGSFTAAITYDRRQKKHIQQKWSDLVAHIAKEPLPLEQSRKRLTIFLSAPPGDGLRPARDYFKEYIKPILVSAALDYEVIEGRKEGEVRAGLADKIRKYRREAGEQSHSAEEPSKESAIAEARERMGVTEEPGPRGDIVIGRHTWKEYVRGLHEGWLGPLETSPPPPQPAATEPVPNAAETTADATRPTVETVDAVVDMLPDTPVVSTQDGSPSEPETPDSNKAQDENTETEESKKPKGPTPAYISSTQYSAQRLPSTIPAAFEASSPIQFPHLLGFLNTPIRLYRYLTKRHLADAVGQEVAAAVLASASRPYNEGSRPFEGMAFDASSTDSSDSLSQTTYEQQTLLEHEEQEWQKSVRKEAKDRKFQLENANPSSTNDPHITKLFSEEREWADEVVIDPRIASRMHRYILSSEEEARANRIASGQEWILGEGEKPKKLSFLQRAWINYGYGEDPELAKKKPIIGNLDNEDGE
jgi:import inner membrane translocase subunit TIM54